MDLKVAVQNHLHCNAYVSFDIFDTAILRDVIKPNDIFLRWQQIILSEPQYSFLHDVDSLSSLRQIAELNARKSVWSNSSYYEVTIKEIYSELCLLLPCINHIVNNLLILELELEFEHFMANPYILSLYNELRAKNVDIMFVSDIYFERTYVDQILQSCGYSSGYTLYLSSETRLSKASGTLYQHILQDRSIAPGNWLHIGDNYESDIVQAKKLSLSTFHYSKCSDRLHADKKLTKRLTSSYQSVEPYTRSVILGSIANHLFSDPDRFRLQGLIHSNSTTPQHQDDIWYKWGFTHAGPLVYGFVQWLYHRASEDRPETIFFLARDGYFIKEIFDLFSSRLGANCNTKYLYASRRLFNLPSIEELNDNDLDFLCSGTSSLSVGDFLARISINPQAYTSQVKSAGFDSSQSLVKTGKDYAKLRKLFMLLKPMILEQASQEASILHDYLLESGFKQDLSCIVVDLGWHGSLQTSLSKLLDRLGLAIALKGYYLATFPPAIKYLKLGHMISGYLCDLGTPASEYQSIRQCVEIYELLFSAPHGTVCGLSNEITGISPILGNDPLDALRWPIASQIQAGAKAFVEQILRNRPISKDIQLSPLHSNAMMASFLASPSFSEARMFGNIQHGEGFGSISKGRYIAKPSISLVNILNIRHHYRELKCAFWMNGYLKRLGVPSRAVKRFLS